VNATENSIKLSRRARILAAVLSAVAFVLSLSFAIESLNLALAGPVAVAEYRFGSESMVGHGGWHYRSRGAYVGSGFAQAALYLTASSLLLVSARRAALRPLVWGSALAVATLLYAQAVPWLRC